MYTDTYTYMHNGILNSAIKKNGILPFVGIWMDKEGILLREMSQRQSLCDFTYVESKKQMNKQNRNRIIDTENKQVVARLGGLGGRISEKSEAK